jgi:hypothetical protein
VGFNPQLQGAAVFQRCKLIEAHDRCDTTRKIRRLRDLMRSGYSSSAISSCRMSMLARFPEPFLARRGIIAWWRAFGFRDREMNVSLQRNDIFSIASMTKPITSVAAMILAERGRLLLPEPVATCLPEFGETPVGIEERSAAEGLALRLVRQERPMSIYDLLRHTAGPTYGSFACEGVAGNTKVRRTAPM